MATTNEPNYKGLSHQQKLALYRLSLPSNRLRVVTDDVDPNFFSAWIKDEYGNELQEVDRRTVASLINRHLIELYTDQKPSINITFMFYRLTPATQTAAMLARYFAKFIHTPRRPIAINRP